MGWLEDDEYDDGNDDCDDGGCHWLQWWTKLPKLLDSLKCNQRP